MAERIEKIGLFYADISTWRKFIESLPELSFNRENRNAGSANKYSDRRTLTRCRIIDNSGKPLTLSVPMSHACPTEISNHGRWQNMHLNALRTIYSRTPYFAHLMPLLLPLYQIELPAQANYFFSRGEEIICRMLNLPQICSDLNRMALSRSNLYNTLRSQWHERLNADMWIGDALFRYGPETIWGLIPDIKNE